MIGTVVDGCYSLVSGAVLALERVFLILNSIDPIKSSKQLDSINGLCEPSMR